MPDTNNKNKIYVLLIICIGIVISVWLVNRSSNKIAQLNNIDPASKNSPVEIVTNYNENTNDEWKKLLVKLDPSKEITTSVVKSDSKTFDETTLTAQLSRDLMSQYLTLKAGGREVTSAELSKVIDNVLSVPDYTKSGGATYLNSNLKITSKSDKETVENYKKLITASIKKAFSQVKDDPYVIIANAAKLEKVSELKKLDPIITASKIMMNELLSMSVPQGAVILHLALLNSLSYVLSDLEGIRAMFDDPVRSLTALRDFDGHRTSFINAVNSMGQYIIKK